MTPVLKVNYIAELRKYQIFKYENESPRLLCYAGSPLELIQKVTTHFRKDLSTGYELTHSPESWRSLSLLERNVLEGICDLHTKAVHEKMRDG